MHTAGQSGPPSQRSQTMTNPTDKQVRWANDIRAKFAGTQQSDVLGEIQRAGQERATEVLGELTPDALAAFLARCDEHIAAADPRWIIEERDFLGTAAAAALLRE